MWIGTAPIGSLRYQIADPANDFVTQFDCGDGPYSNEVNRFFRGAKWVQTKQPTEALQFGFDHDPNVGLVALRLVGVEQIILVRGVAKPWQGRRDPADARIRVVDSIIESAAEIARQDGAAHLVLRVREGNSRAIATYLRNGFSERDRLPRVGDEVTLVMTREL